MARRAYLLLGALVLSACPTHTSTSLLDDEGDEVAYDTSLGEGDVIELRVFGEDDFSGAYRVSSDGTIAFPFIGDVQVLGLEPRAAADAVAHSLEEAQILVSPQVTVYVREYNSKRVSVLGAVQRPGTFPLQPGLTAVQAVSLAGGLSALASRNSVVLTRRQPDGTVRRVQLALGQIARGEGRDILIRPGDIIFVPERVF